MRPIDSKPLGEALTALADVFGVRPPSPAAVTVWADALREFPIEPVLALLRGWPKMHGKMPAPRDLWSVLNDERTEDLERKAADDKRRERNEVQRLFDPRVRDANMAKIRDIVAKARDAGMPTGPQLAQAMLEEAATGERRLGMAQRAFVMHNLRWTQEQIDEVEAAGAAMRDAA